MPAQDRSLYYALHSCAQQGILCFHIKCENKRQRVHSFETILSFRKSRIRILQRRTYSENEILIEGIGVRTACRELLDRARFSRPKPNDRIFGAFRVNFAPSAIGTRTNGKFLLCRKRNRSQKNSWQVLYSCISLETTRTKKQYEFLQLTWNFPASSWLPEDT